MGVVGQERGNRRVKREKAVSKRRQSGVERYREVVGTIVGGFNHSDAICSTLFFALTVDIFPGETGGGCVRACGRQQERLKDRTEWTQSTLRFPRTYSTSELYDPGSVSLYTHTRSSVTHSQ